MPDTDRLRIFLFGPPRIEWCGQEYGIPRRQVRALLYRLAADLQPQSRDYLCYIFWPDSPQDQARRRLTHLQTHLHTALPQADQLIIADDHIGLNPEHIWVDVLSLDQNLRSAKVNETLDPTAITQLYASGFLDGFNLPRSPAYENWIAIERNNQERKYLLLLDMLINRHVQVHEYDMAIWLCQTYLQVNELAEEIHRRLIELYILKNEISAARAQYQHCATLLERELGIAPLPETQHIFETTRPGITLSPVVQEAQPAGETPVPPMIGREHELLLLERAYLKALAGEGNVCFISGESGIGKSRLISEFIDLLPESATILKGHCYAGTQTMPYFPLYDIVSWQNMVTDADQSMLIQVFADAYHNDAHHRLAKFVGVDAFRMRIYTLLDEIFRQASAQKPVVVCLEDLQWSDTATLDWLAYWGHRLRKLHVLLLVTYCCSANERITVFQNRLQHMQLPIQTIALEGLQCDEIHQFFRIDSETNLITHKLKSHICQVTGGNPLYALELRYWLQNRQNVPDTEGHDLPHNLPASLEQAIRVRLAGISPLARQTLEIIAVLQIPRDFNVIHRMSGRTEIKIAEALDELMQRKLIMEWGGNYGFQHVVVRVIVLHDLSAARHEALRRRMHAIRSAQPAELDRTSVDNL